MKQQLRFALLTGALITSALALSATPALAKGMPEGVPPHGNGPGSSEGSPTYGPPGDVTPGPKAGLPAKAKAYGRYCKGESHKRVKGDKSRSAFSLCVTALAKAANNDAISTKRACHGLSKKHIKGEGKGTAFSRCVHDANRLRKKLHREAREQARQEREEKKQEEQEAS